MKRPLSAALEVLPDAPHVVEGQVIRSRDLVELRVGAGVVQESQGALQHPEER